MPYMLYVGDRRHYKGFSDFVAAYASWNMRSQVRLIVAGRACQPWEEEWFKIHGVAADIDFIVNPSDSRLRDLYCNASAFVYPSLWEGFGIPLLEAMSCSCPVVASDIPSTREIAGDYPYYFRPGSSDNILPALTACVEHGTRLPGWGVQRAREFSWEADREGISGCLLCG